MELFFENEKMDVDALEVYDWQTIALVTNGERIFHKSEFGWDVNEGFELKVSKAKNK